jgi:uncharacterized protein
MMEFRTVPQPLEVRNLSQRLVCGRVVPYGHDQWIHDRLTERFERGAFNHQLRAANRVRFYNGHSINNGQHIGAGVLLRDEDEGLWGEFRIADSTLGNHYLQMCREGMLTQWSMGFVPDKERRDGATTVYTRATLFEMALVEQGAYGELASVAAVRAVVPQMSRDVLLAKLPPARLPL